MTGVVVDAAPPLDDVSTPRFDDDVIILRLAAAAAPAAPAAAAAEPIVVIGRIDVVIVVDVGRVNSSNIVCCGLPLAADFVIIIVVVVDVDDVDDGRIGKASRGVVCLGEIISIFQFDHHQWKCCEYCLNLREREPRRCRRNRRLHVRIQQRLFEYTHEKIMNLKTQ